MNCNLVPILYWINNQLDTAAVLMTQMKAIMRTSNSEIYIFKFGNTDSLMVCYPDIKKM